MRLGRLILVGLTVIAYSGAARAEDIETKPAPLPALPALTHWEGFANFQINYADYSPNVFRSYDKSRPNTFHLTTDLTKLNLSTDWKLAFGAELHSEIEFRHGGFDQENEVNYLGNFADGGGNGGKSGGLVLSQFFIKKSLADHVSFALGKIPVAVGFLSLANRPTDYAAVTPSETEVQLIPREWTELGGELHIDFEHLAFTTQVVNGLDSSGFSSRGFVANGQQGRYSQQSIADPALVERLDFKFSDGNSIGQSFYSGDSSRNRPTDDLARPCATATVDTAPSGECGFIHTPVRIAEEHLNLNLFGVEGQFLYLHGQVKNTNAINLANRADASNLPARYSPVADDVLGMSATVDFPIVLASKSTLQPYLRFEHYNTMLSTDDTSNLSPVFERKVYSGGLEFVSNQQYYVKSGVLHRAYGSNQFKTENEVEIDGGLLF